MVAKFRGTFVALVTPFDRRGALDIPALERLIEHCIQGGVDGLVPCGTTGEAATLDRDEYHKVVEITLSAANGRIPVIVGAGSNNTKLAVEKARFAKEAGATAVLSVVPYYNKPTQEGLYRHFATLVESADVPVVVYNIPGRSAVEIAPETLKRLWVDERIRGLKDASGGVYYTMDLVHSGLPDGFSILSGDDSLTLALIACGAHGCISVAANEIPGPFTRLTHLALDGQTETAREILNQYLDLMNVNFIESNPAPVKTALGLMGLIEAHTRAPICELSASSLVRLRHVLLQVGLIPGQA